jgi:hypothetical protein
MKHLKQVLEFKIKSWARNFAMRLKGRSLLMRLKIQFKTFIYKTGFTYLNRIYESAKAKIEPYI